MFTYQRMLRTILKDGKTRTNRTGVNTLGIFGYQFRHPLLDGGGTSQFPLLTTKKIFLKGVVEELLWMLRGETNVRSLQAAGVHIWDEWANAENGELGPVYGAQWRNFGGVDQIAQVIHSLWFNRDSRRHLVSAWNPPDLPHQALPPCHVMFQFDVCAGRLSCHMYQRSADAFLGVPFNIASYALLTHIIAYRTNLIPGDLIISYGDLHIYNNHFDAVEEQLSRRPRKLPMLHLDLPGYQTDQSTDNPFTGNYREPWDIKADEVQIINYDPHPSIKAAVAV